MKKEDIDLIKSAVKKTKWTDEEIEHIKDMMENGIRACDLKENTALMDKYFPGRSYVSLDAKLRRMKENG